MSVSTSQSASSSSMRSPGFFKRATTLAERIPSPMIGTRSLLPGVVAGGVCGTGCGCVSALESLRPAGVSVPSYSALSVHRDRTLDRPNDPLHIGQGGVFVDRIVTDHDVAFADQNWRTDHRLPELRLASDVRNDHLTDAAILGVFLHDDEPAGLADRFARSSRDPTERWSGDRSIRRSLCRRVLPALRSISPLCCPTRRP